MVKWWRKQGHMNTYWGNQKDRIVSTLDCQDALNEQLNWLPHSTFNLFEGVWFVFCFPIPSSFRESSGSKSDSPRGVRILRMFSKLKNHQKVSELVRRHCYSWCWLTHAQSDLESQMNIQTQQGHIQEASCPSYWPDLWTKLWVVILQMRRERGRKMLSKEPGPTTKMLPLSSLRTSCSVAAVECRKSYGFLNYRMGIQKYGLPSESFSSPSPYQDWREK